MKGRLDRGRDRLRNRLVKRGLELSPALLAVMLAESTVEALPPALATATATAGTAGQVAPAVATLARGVLLTMFWTKFGKAAVAVLVLGLIAIGIALAAYRGTAGEERATASLAAAAGDDPRAPTRLVLRKLPLQLKLPNAACLVFSPDSKSVFVGGGEKPITLRDLVTGEERAQFDGHKDWIKRLVVSDDGRLLAGLAADGIHVWEVRSGKKVGGTPMRPTGPTGWSGLAFSPKGILVYGGAGSGVRRWDAAAQKELPALDAIRPVRRWSGKDGKELPALPGDAPCEVFSVAVASDGNAIAASCVYLELSTTSSLSFKENGSCVCMIDVKTGKARRLVERCGEPQVVLSPDGKTLAVCGGSTLPHSLAPHNSCRVLDVESGKELSNLNKLGFPVGFTPDGKIIVALSSPGVVFWQVETGKELCTLDAPKIDEGHWSSLALSPDGKCLAVASSKGVVNLWAVAQAK